MMKRRIDEKARLSTLADGVLAAAQRGQALTRQLLAFARRGAQEPVDFRLQHRAEALAELVRRSLRSDIAFDFALPPETWTIRADPEALEIALINLAVCLPLNWYGLARREPAASAEEASRPAASLDGPPLGGRARTVAMVLFALVMSINAFVFGVITVQLVPLLEAAGLATAAAVWVASLKGFAQFGGRVVEIVFASTSPLWVSVRASPGVVSVGKSSFVQPSRRAP